MRGAYLIWRHLFCPRPSVGWRGIVSVLFERCCCRLACVLPVPLKESVVADAYAHAITKRRRRGLAPFGLDDDGPAACDLLVAYKRPTEE